MLSTIDFILNTTHILFILAINIFSLFIIFSKRSVPLYMKLFVWYPIVGIVLIVLTLVFQFEIIYILNKKHVLFAIYNLSLIFHFIFLSLFIILQYPSKKFKAFIIIFYLTILFFLLKIYLQNSIFLKPLHSPIPISCFGLIVFCSIYFYQILTIHLNNYSDLKKQPIFWIVSGVFVSMGFLFPLPITVKYLQLKGLYFSSFIPHVTSYFSFILLHLFFLKAYICTLRTSKV